ncbi:IPT/TIG domain-containing protein, partial [Polymorphospora sp. NPDC050346]|uniref:IPT/TIG domain-containing protein n=1 Tax=Polymorphospora sp. NPDC050346 TaxID=3155780 RepID=UPI0033D8365D
PTGNAGDVHVQVTTPGGTSATSVDNRYTYVPAPTITAVSPNTGPPAGGNTVTITGTDLTGATITFGSGNNATDVSCTATSCTAVVPAGSIGTLHVQATTIGGTSATSVDNQYTYAAADLSVAITATGVPGLLNGHIDYTITITNNGPSTLSSATVTATLPIPMTATSSDCTTGAGSVTCAVGPLASGASVTRSIRVPVGLLTIGIPYTVTATRTASAPVDLNPNNDSASRSCTVVSSLIILCH